ncbi:hypothetical protein IJU97_06050 [bacterium]|nr:hypothetical protein [bacterium]
MYKIPEQIEEAVTPPFDFMKFYSAIKLLEQNIESIEVENALNNYMNIHVLCSWIFDHIVEVKAIPATAESFADVVNLFGRNNAVDGAPHSGLTNRCSQPGIIPTTGDIFVGETSMEEIYQLDEKQQIPFIEAILSAVAPFKGKLTWYSGAMHLTPPHHC